MTGGLFGIENIGVVHIHNVTKAVKLFERILVLLLGFIVCLFLHLGFPTRWAVGELGHMVNAMFRRDFSPPRPHGEQYIPGGALACESILLRSTIRLAQNSQSSVG